MSGKETNNNDIYDGFKRRAEQITKDRVNKISKTSRMNKTVGLMLTTFVGSVYLYSMFAVKQEKFLDEIVDIEESKQVN
ncbi:unnamed protein product [Medioppia subpectinata]|uniref:Cytochrome c oxidase assembly factor 3 mitochondrial coiled-coil domain-containing protein n=1 Tax=Medioppia subpectinata TaxID=1979941 RepID=A0A7R9Q3X6_9ACAR|nr:unnamed protein product [Medioppia subpectinata]CAG2111964.1 unnamed protein product [Medioppia subpectinata]